MLLGVDLGGTKTEIIALEPNDGTELYRQRVSSPRGDYQETLKNIVSLVALAEQATERKAAAIGVGIPGTISLKTGNVKNANSTWLNGNPLGEDLKKALGRPVAVDNDANCFAVSEAVDGAGAGAEMVFGVIIGTGCGAGLAHNGKAHIGQNGLGGEWGHNPLPYPRLYSKHATQDQDHTDQARRKILSPTYQRKKFTQIYTDDPLENEYPGPACYCGKTGCLETWISGTGLENDYARRSSKNLSGKEIVSLAQHGDDSHAIKAVAQYTDRLARGLSGVINILDPDVIVLGGGMGNISSLYQDLPALLEQYCFTDRLDVTVKPPVHGDSSGVRGAAWLVR